MGVTMGKLDNDRILFLRVGWMERYEGDPVNDKMHGGGSFIDKEGYGHEIFNFLPYKGVVYGYAQPPSRTRDWANSTINLNRIDQNVEGDSLRDVLVVWVATSRLGGSYIVGWYKNATVYRSLRDAPDGSNRTCKNGSCGYFVMAKATDARLLSTRERVFPMPPKGKGMFGQSNVWYADNPRLNTFRHEVKTYILNEKLSKNSTRTIPRQSDIFKRQEVERIAIMATSSYFNKLGYSVESFESDNLGWDLVAKLNNRELKLEVKGLSGVEVCVELTPNEYKAMNKHKSTYLLCVVTQALTNPSLQVFEYSFEWKEWISEKNNILRCSEFTGARFIV
jgi:Domain of unknown function (DUF3883)